MSQKLTNLTSSFPYPRLTVSKERLQARILGSGLLGTRGYMEDLVEQSPKYSQYALCEEKANCWRMLNNVNLL